MDNKIYVATPMYGGMCTAPYALALMNLPPTLYQNNIRMGYGYVMNESLITRARNDLTHEFLKSDCTHLMFIDADIGFNPNDIPPMVEADKDIIGGIYPKKDINWYSVAAAVKKGVPPEQLAAHTGAFVLNFLNNQTTATGDINQPLEVQHAGTGFLLIKRKVFEKLAETVPSYTLPAYLVVDSANPAKIVKEFFTTSINPDDNQLLSEDYHFCRIARQAGFKIYVAPWPELTHTGTYAFSGSVRAGPV